MSLTGEVNAEKFYQSSAGRILSLTGPLVINSARQIAGQAPTTPITEARSTRLEVMQNMLQQARNSMGGLIGGRPINRVWFAWPLARQ